MLAAFALLTLGGGGALRAETEPEAAAVLDRMFKAYASTAAFSCEGSCDDHEDGSTLPADHRTVTMHFVRPDRFRLAWTQKDFHGKSGTSVIYTQEGQTFVRQWDAKHAEPEPSLGQALDGCAGISLGLSYLVPALLLGDPGYLRFDSLRLLTDGGNADGHSCHKLAGETNEGTRWELLIDRETGALREALEVNVLPTTPAHAVRTQYRFTDIRFTDSLPDSVFAESNPTAHTSKR